MRKEKTKKKLLDWMMSEEYYTANLKKLNIEKHETIGGLDLPKGRELKEEVIENSKKQLRSKNGIGGTPTNYRRRRRADQQKSAAAALTNCRRRRRGAAGAQL